LEEKKIDEDGVAMKERGEKKKYYRESRRDGKKVGMKERK